MEKASAGHKELKKFSNLTKIKNFLSFLDARGPHKRF
jgi:hypothetical protein